MSDVSSFKPLVSVIMPCHNYGRFLSRALGSLQAQTLQDWEAIVVDDGSTDDSRAAAARWARQDARVRVLSQPCAGPSAARNAGLRLARGDFMQLLDADDGLQPDKLRFQAQWLQQQPDIDIACGSVQFFREQHLQICLQEREDKLSSDEYAVQGTGHDALRKLLRHNVIFINAVLLRRRVFEAVGLLDETLLAVEDWDFWLRCAQAGMRFAFQDAPGTRALVRIHPSSLSTDRRRTLSATLHIRRKLEASLGDLALRRVNHRQAQEEQAALWFQEGMHGSPGKAAASLLRAALTHARPRWAAYALGLALAQDSRGRRLLARLHRLKGGR